MLKLKWKQIENEENLRRVADVHTVGYNKTQPRIERTYTNSMLINSLLYSTGIRTADVTDFTDVLKYIDNFLFSVFKEHSLKKFVLTGTFLGKTEYYFWRV